MRPRFRSIHSAFLLACIFTLAGCSSAEQRAQSHYERGVELVAKGDLARAGVEFNNAVKLNPKSADALFAMGDVEQRRGNFDAAVGLFASVAEQQPKHVQARVRLAYIFLAAGQLDAATKYADEAMAIDDGDASALVVKAAVELKLDNRGNAARLAQAALAADPKSEEARMVLASERLAASDPAAALAYLDQASEASFTNLGLQVLRLTALDKLGDQSGVEQLFGKLIEVNPDSPGLRDAFVKWYMQKDRKDDAERVLRQFASDNPDDAQSQLNLVAFLNTEKGADAALIELERLTAARLEKGGDTFALRMALAQLQFAQGDQSRALEVLRSIVSDETDAARRNDARIQLARVLAATEDLKQAEAVVAEVLADDPKSVDGLTLRAAFRLAAGGDTASAIDDLQTLLNEAPDNARAHELLAEAYERQGSTALALEHYAKALSLEQNAPEIGMKVVRFLMRYGRVEEARRTLEAVRTQSPTNRDVLTLLAQLRLSTQDWIGAQEIADTLRDLDSGKGDPAADRIAAAALGGLDRSDESISLLEQTFSSAKDSKEVLPGLVGAYVRAGRWADAMALLQPIIDTDPGNVQAQILLGSVHMTMNRPDLAEVAFKKAAALADDTLGDTALAQFYLSIGRLADAEGAARTGLEHDSDSASLHLLLAAILERAERFDEAIAEYETLLRSDPQSTVAANGLASLLSERRIGDKESLDRAYEVAQRFRNSEVPQFLDTLGWIHYLRGDYSSALPLLRTAAERLPDTALVQYHFGMVLKQLGQTASSVAALEKALAGSPPLIESDTKLAQAALNQLQTAAASESN